MNVSKHPVCDLFLLDKKSLVKHLTIILLWTNTRRAGRRSHLARLSEPSSHRRRTVPLQTSSPLFLPPPPLCPVRVRPGDDREQSVTLTNYVLYKTLYFKYNFVCCLHFMYFLCIRPDGTFVITLISN